MKPLSTPTKVYQDDFRASKGNALQAAVASLFGQSLHDVPNFITSNPSAYLHIMIMFQRYTIIKFAYYEESLHGANMGM